MNIDFEMVEKAKALCKEIHSTAVYNIDGKLCPYYYHCFAVADVLREFAESDVDLNLCIVVAYLHDSIEDTDITYEYVKNNFNTLVADGVLALTKDENLKKEERIFDSVQRIVKSNVKEFAMVKMADRIINLQNIPHYWTVDKAKNYLQDAKYIYDNLSYASEKISKKLSESMEEYKYKIIDFEIYKNRTN